MRDALLKEFMSSGFKDGKTRVSPEALSLTSVFVRVFVHEALHRATAEGQSLDAHEVEAEVRQ